MPAEAQSARGCGGDVGSRRSAPSSGLRILLACPSSTSQWFMWAILGRAGYVVHTVPDAEIALEIVQKGWFFDLLVTDLDRPTTQGAALIWALRLSRPWLPVVVLATAPAEERVASLRNVQEGPLIPLCKPASAADLLDAVGAALGQSAPVIGVSSEHCQSSR
jgi:CheY-like chemotaxis protein